MKRVNGIDEKGSEILVSKKARIFNGQVDRDGDPFGISVSADPVDLNIWDFDINFDSIFGNEGAQNAPLFDLNFPAIETGSLDYPVEIIDIASDDSDGEVEITGYTVGYSANGKGIELGISQSEERRDSAVDGRLSINANYSTDLDNHVVIDGLISGEVEVGRQQPPALPPSRAESSNRQAFRISAKEFVRTHFSERKRGNGNVSCSEKQPLLEGDSDPFSEALKIILKRNSKGLAARLIEWKPREGNQDKRIVAACVPSLLDLSLRALAENAEGIVSLELVPDDLRRKLADILCDVRKMNVDMLNMLVEGCPTEIRIKNCSWLTDKQCQQTLGNCEMNDLRMLQLDLCGQCMLGYAFKDILNQPTSFANLTALSLRGACRLTDTEVINLVSSAPALRSLNLGQCTLLTCNAINFIADSLGRHLRELYIDDCQKIDAMQILPAFEKLRCLEVISVAGLNTVTDQFVSTMVTQCGESIKEVDLSNCLELTDCAVEAIGGNCSGLRSLNMSYLPNLTDLSMRYLANRCRSIKTLKLCRNGFSDEAMAAFLESSGESLTELSLNNVSEIGPNTALSLAKRSRKLRILDVSWCRRITNEALGLIVDNCSSLKLLKVFGCRQITDTFVKGHSNPSVRIIGRSLTPILDHVNLHDSDEV